MKPDAHKCQKCLAEKPCLYTLFFRAKVCLYKGTQRQFSGLHRLNLKTTMSSSAVFKQLRINAIGEDERRQFSVYL